VVDGGNLGAAVMARKIPWPKAPFVTLSQAAATLHGKHVEYTEVNAGNGPFGGVGRLHVGKENATGKHQVYIVFTLHDGDETFEHAVPLRQEHIDSLEPIDFATARAHFRCGRLIES
jgi:hypothetical protein